MTFFTIVAIISVVAAGLACCVAVLALIQQARNPPPKRVSFSGDELNAVHWAVRKQLDVILPTHPTHDALYAAKERIES